MAPCGRDEIATQLRLTIVQLKPVYERVGRLCQATAAVKACAFYRRFVLFCLNQARTAEPAPPPADEAAHARPPKGGKSKRDPSASAEKEKAGPVAIMGEAEAAASCMAQLQRVQALTLGDSDAAPTLAGSGAAGAASAGAVAEVDWGDADEAGAAPLAKVDWGAEIEGGAAASVVEVDWGGDEAGAGGNAIEVDWGGDGDAATGWGGLIEVEAGDDGECGGLSVILEDAAERNKLMSELLELAGVPCLPALRASSPHRRRWWHPRPPARPPAPARPVQPLSPTLTLTRLLQAASGRRLLGRPAGGAGSRAGGARSLCAGSGGCACGSRCRAHAAPAAHARLVRVREAAGGGASAAARPRGQDERLGGRASHAAGTPVGSVWRR